VDPLAVVVVVLAVAVAANVLLTLAVVRRLAAHERKLASFAPLLGAASGIGPGTAVPSFAATTADGRSVDPGFLGDGPSVVAFFSTDCDACLSHAPQFAALAASAPALAVVSGDGGEELPRKLGDMPVVRELEPGGAITGAFEVDTFPTYYAIDRGHVAAQAGSAEEVGDLLARARRS